MEGRTLAPYACDRCKSRKISCSRRQPACQRCLSVDAVCNYSRSGVIRRNRKRKYEHPITPTSSLDSPHRNDGPYEASSTSVQSHLASDIETTRDRLNDLGITQDTSLGALSSLSEACAAVWHNASELDMTGQTFFLFEQRTSFWVDTFEKTLRRGAPLFTLPPLEVLDQLRTCKPQQVQQKAWLVMYYGIILSLISSTDPMDESTKLKLRCNLWLSLNDVRLLLEPSEPNIQALILLAVHVEEFTTPSLCWMLVSNACRMLQALGVNHWRLDNETRERRFMTFWHLSILDTGLAIIFGRPPTFHKAEVAEIDLPSLEQLMRFQPHVTSEKAAMFGAHFLHQMLLLSQILVDVWDLLYGSMILTVEKRESLIERLHRWYRQAKELLEAAILVERPFLDAKSTRSIELGLASTEMQYQYSLVLLCRSGTETRAECLEASKRMLKILEKMVSDSEEPYNGIVWQLICCPFTAFLVLFGEVISNGSKDPNERNEALVAMELLPLFLNRMSIRNSLAAKLEKVAVIFVQHARSVVNSHDSACDESIRMNSMDYASPLESKPLGGDDFDFNAFFTNVTTLLPPDPGQTDDTYVQQPLDPNLWTNDFFKDVSVDWMGWASQS